MSDAVHLSVVQNAHESQPAVRVRAERRVLVMVKKRCDLPSLVLFQNLTPLPARTVLVQKDLVNFRIQ